MADDLRQDKPFFDETSVAWEEESLFARDINGQLIRLEKATSDDFDKDVTVTIDGQQITVKKAVPLTDAQGNIVNDPEGRPTPRFTTIYDAANSVYVRRPGEVNPIPILCHQPHMRPAAVCRVCSVEICRLDRAGKESRGKKLVPACFQPVEPGMIVHTLRSPDPKASQRVRDSVKVLTELLCCDHLGASTPTKEKPATPSDSNELSALLHRLKADGVEVNPSRFRMGPPAQRGHDFESSDLIRVDHSACILCERCIRACDEIKHNQVIGRSGKGYTAKVAFDLNDPLGYSSCVSCGECMISCPTDALTLKPHRQVESDWRREQVDQYGSQPLDARRLRELHELFRVVPEKFLEWNADAAVLRPIRAGEMLCRQGDHGATAYILLPGCKVAILDDARRRGDAEPASPGVLDGLLARFFSRRESAGVKRSSSSPAEDFFQRSSAEHADAYRRTITALKNGEQIDREVRRNGQLIAVRDDKEMVLGEMSCLSYQRRSATMISLADAQVIEVRRNILHVLQRNPAAGEMLDRVYRKRALNAVLNSIDAFTAAEWNADATAKASASDKIYRFLKDKISLVRVDPGQVVFRQGERVEDFFVVRVGYVKVTQRRQNNDVVLNYLGPGKHFGEIGLVAQLQELQAELGADRLPAELWGRRTATCTALDHVELVRIPGAAFVEVVRKFEPLRRKYAALIRELLQREEQIHGKVDPLLEDFLGQGLFNAQKLLVLDLERCTRCDECTKACSDTHAGIPRLIREGLRFGRFLVASACRSCEDPYCLVGCPVDAIHRGQGLEIKIENHCIGCGLCAMNCPYGNINMEPVSSTRASPKAELEIIRQAATTCDLCVNIVGPNSRQPVSCVYACPHEAAFRMSGAELYREVASSANGKQ